MTPNNNRALDAREPDHCSHCGETFAPTRPGQKFCRPSCRRAHFTRKPQQLRLPLGDAGDLFREPFEDDHQVGKC